MRPHLIFLILFCFISSPAWANKELEALYNTVNEARNSIHDLRFCNFLAMVKAWIHFSIVAELGPGIALDQVSPDFTRNFLKARESLLIYLRVSESYLDIPQSWSDPLSIINERFLTSLSASVSFEWAQQLLASEFWRAVFEADLIDCLQVIINNIPRVEAEF